MRRNRLPLGVSFLLVLFAAAHIAFYAPLLPDTVASHFSGSGRADGWSSKESFLVVYGVCIAATTVIFVGLALVIPRFPASMINIPDRDYWLAPERRQETMDTTVAFLLWIGCGTLAFLIAIMHLTFRANLGPSPDLGGAFWVIFVGYLFFTIAATVWLLVRFTRR